MFFEGQTKGIKMRINAFIEMNLSFFTQCKESNTTVLFVHITDIDIEGFCDSPN